MQETKLEHNTNFHHIVPVKVYLATFLALGVLTAITVFVAYVDLGLFNVPVALGIATLKATLVVMYFMHVKYGGKLIPLSVTIGVLMFLLMVVGTMQDYWTRDNFKMQGLNELPAVVTPAGVIRSPLDAAAVAEIGAH